MSADHELVSAYATEGSESAFRALVKRHVDLVYATAWRQVGDAGMAEEITQNVFIALARKAPRLGRMETLAGWLHRTALLESKARIRAELRRRRREEVAAEMARIAREGSSLSAALVPMLDEALLQLRESDRSAVILRFWEERSLREVGTALGIDEDAARKRVARALERLSSYFRQRGFVALAGTGLPALLAEATSAAPAGLATTAANAGLAAGGAAAAGLNLLWYRFTALSKTQVAALCAVLAACPLLWQGQVQARLQREQAAASARLTALQRDQGERARELERTRQTLLRAQADTQNTESRLATLQTRLAPSTAVAPYRWDDDSPVVRVPKQLLDQVRLAALKDKHGRLSEPMKELLQLTEAETQQIQAAVNRFLADYQTTEVPFVKLVPPTEDELQGYKPEETRVFAIGACKEPMERLRQNLFSELEATLGSERFEIFKQALEGWLPIPNAPTRLSNQMAVLDFERRERFYQPKPGEGWIQWSMTSQAEGNMSSSLEAADVPDLFQPYLQDWISLAQSKPARQAKAK
ncbi:MAG TPA: sigma-70 family RNA polymerase sigma factor [Candidatus Sulfotelmatobacter sp.]|nr:sigma-70 family RNA polymerase sigma factor [Candidatus Sulfotelmatobacter sp.]